MDVVRRPFIYVNKFRHYAILEIALIFPSVTSSNYFTSIVRMCQCISHRALINICVYTVTSFLFSCSSFFIAICFMIFNPSGIERYVDQKALLNLHEREVVGIVPDPVHNSGKLISLPVQFLRFLSLCTHGIMLSYGFILCPSLGHHMQCEMTGY